MTDRVLYSVCFKSFTGLTIELAHWSTAHHDAAKYQRISIVVKPSVSPWADHCG
jgi:hypothetical protein